MFINANQHPQLSLQMSESLLLLHNTDTDAESLEPLFCLIDFEEQMLSNKALLAFVKALVKILVRKVVVIGEACGLP